MLFVCYVIDPFDKNQSCFCPVTVSGRPCSGQLVRGGRRLQLQRGADIHERGPLHPAGVEKHPPDGDCQGQDERWKADHDRCSLRPAGKLHRPVRPERPAATEYDGSQVNQRLNTFPHILYSNLISYYSLSRTKLSLISTKLYKKYSTALSKFSFLKT